MSPLRLICSAEASENLDNIVFTTLTTLRRGDCYVSATLNHFLTFNAHSSYRYNLSRVLREHDSARCVNFIS